MLAVIRQSPAPLAVTEVAEQVGLHVNTVRGHLELLVHLGGVTRQAEHRGVRGRPRILYQLAQDATHDGALDPALATSRAQELSNLARSDHGDPDEEGRLWAATLLQEGTLHPAAGDEDALAQVARVFADLGFDATAGPLGDRFYLRGCPFAALRDDFPRVCDIHVGLLRGSLTAVGASASLDHFDVDARPGLCVAHLARVPATKECS